MTFDRAVVVVPAHDEAEKLPKCLKAILTSATCLTVPVLVVVVLDACTDGSEALAGRFGSDVHFVEVDAKNVGATRAAGFVYAREVARAIDESRIWYATTDADSRVDGDWLLRQMAADADMVLGVVRVTNWRHFSAASVRRYLDAYRAKSQSGGGGHGHVHGANMGFRADAYWASGGFATLASGEDVDLVRRFEEGGRRIHRDAGLSVETSARRDGRAPRGFGRPPQIRRATRRSGVTAALVRRWLDAGELELPAPGSGRTGSRWWKLAAMAENDVVAGRLAEAHTDALAILAELGGKTPGPGQLWGVWAAEAPQFVVTVKEDDDGQSVLEGTKAWCSGAGICTHALITARRDDNGRGLYAVDLSQDGVEPLADGWHNVGMHASDTRSVQLSNAIGVPVGRPGEYLSRPGFWHGAMGVAACWLGGARGVAAPLYRAVAAEHEGAVRDVHAHAHLGAVDAALAAAEAMLVSAACYVDAEPHGDRAELIARRVRAVVEHAVDEAITRTGRALGPAPLVLDERHAQRVADLTIYVRQSHAERDLAALGKAAAR